jgi:mercuric ion transport protein
MATATTMTFTVRGFHCSGCADNVQTALSNLEGVIRVKADFDDSQVEVRFDPDRATETDIRDQITASGFQAD